MSEGACESTAGPTASAAAPAEHERCGGAGDGGAAAPKRRRLCRKSAAPGGLYGRAAAEEPRHHASSPSLPASAAAAPHGQRKATQPRAEPPRPLGPLPCGPLSAPSALPWLACPAEALAPGAQGLAPPDFRLREKHAEFVIVQNAFDEELLQRTMNFLKRKRPQPAKMKNEGGGDSDDERKARYDDRDSRVSWFNAMAECPFLHQRLADLVRHVGNKHFPLLKADPSGRLKCEYEETQYATYGPNQHFKAWHQDAYADGNDPEDARQITVVAMLTDRSSYSGGQFEVKIKGADGRKKQRRIALEAGEAILFPAKKLVHRVLEVKSGIRKTLVFWAFDRASCKYHTGQVDK